MYSYVIVNYSKSIWRFLHTWKVAFNFQHEWLTFSHEQQYFLLKWAVVHRKSLCLYHLWTLSPSIWICPHQCRTGLFKTHKFEFSLLAFWGHSRVPGVANLGNILTFFFVWWFCYKTDLPSDKISWRQGSCSPSTERYVNVHSSCFFQRPCLCLRPVLPPEATQMFVVYAVSWSCRPAPTCNTSSRWFIVLFW